MKRVRQFFSRYRNGLQRAGAVLLALAVWQGLAMGVGQQLLVPSPLSVVERLGGIWQEADFWGTVWFTFRKIVAGFLLGLGFGLGLGALAGRFPLFEILFRPWATMIKSIPVASFIIICLIWMSSSRLSIFISFLMVLPIVYTNVLQSIRSADRQLLEAVSIFRLSWPKRALYLWLPQLKPYLLSACTVSLGISWKAGIAAEIIGIPAGSIGRMFYDAKVYFNTVDLFAWTVIVVVADIGIRLVREDFFLATPEEMVFPRSGLSLQSSQVTMMTPGEAESVSKNGQTIPDVAQEIALRSQRLVRVLGKHSLVTDGYRTYFMEEGEYPAEIASLGEGERKE